MNVEFLRRFLAAQPGTPGQHFARSIALDRIAAGSVDHAAALTGLVGPGLILAPIEAEAAPAMLRAAIQTAAYHWYREMPSFVRAIGGRTVLADWCRKAEFSAPAGLPETVDIYRGTMGCSPAANVSGLHWALEFDKAAYYAAKHADSALTGVIVVHARVPRQELVAFLEGVAASEVIPASVPTSYDVIVDKDRIGDAAVRFVEYRHSLVAKGYVVIPTHNTAELVASQARARMAAAGVERGTAIVSDAPATPSPTPSSSGRARS